MYIALAILAFGIIIAIHELGHFLTAKAMNVKVLEFSIGMGPKLLSKQGKETLYSLRLIPFGGFCSMEGEYGEKLEDDEDDDRSRPSVVEKVTGELAGPDLLTIPDLRYLPDREDNDERFKPAKPVKTKEKESPEEPDPRSFIAQKRWKRIVILAAGSIANIILAFIIIVFLSLGAEGFGSTTLSNVVDKLPDEGPSEILPGDKIIAINGERLYYYNDYALFMNLNTGKPITITILRDGQRIEYQRRSYAVDGEEVYRYILSFAVNEPTALENFKYSCYQTFNFIRLIRVSISMMASGSASVTEVAGPIGIIDAMNTVGQESPNIGAAIANIVYFTAFIGVNVAVINLLPIPAMDGGRILFIFITWVVEKTTRKELDPKYENYINTGAFMLLIGLMIVIMFNDIVRIIGG